MTRGCSDSKYADAAQIFAMTGLDSARFENLVERHRLQPRYFHSRRTFDLEAVWRALDADRTTAVMSGEAAA